MLFEIGPIFKGNKPGEQSTMIGAIKTGKYSRKNWIEKERNFDVFDIKNDALRTLNEIGISTSKISVSNKTKKWYHPGRSGLLSLGSSISLGGVNGGSNESIKLPEKASSSSMLMLNESSELMTALYK